MYTVPILYIVFNRPTETQQSFEALRKIKPSKLYISADGPRQHKPDDFDKSQEVKSIVSKIDWDCEVKTLFHDNNLGCRVAPETALEWFFKNETEGIIIEDDIIPNAGFFEFCQTMLERYRNDPTVFSVNGCSLGYHNPKEPYGATRYFNMWGWATWRRSYELVQKTWSAYTPEMGVDNDPTMKKNLHLPYIFKGNAKWRQHWQGLFNDVYYKRIDTVWDYQWTYTVLKTSQFCIRPSDNFVVNIGSGAEATHHTFDEAPIFNFVYTAPHFSDKKINKLKVDSNFEIFNVAGIVHSHFFRSFTKKYLKLYFEIKTQKLKSILKK